MLRNWLLQRKFSKVVVVRRNRLCRWPITEGERPTTN